MRARLVGTHDGGTAAIVHLTSHLRAVRKLEPLIPRLHAWACRLAVALCGGARVLIAGNGGSAAQAQHLAAELVGRYRRERQALSAIALHAETSSLTAIANDLGWDDVYARQVSAHGRRGDLLLLLSTSGESANLLAAAAMGREIGLTIWSLTGPLPNRLAEEADESVAVDGTSAVVQEIHLVAIHILCAAVEEALS